MHCIHCIPHIATVRASLALIAGIIPVVATAGAPPSTSSGGTPFGALPFAVPAQFEAEDFDRGGLLVLQPFAEIRFRRRGAKREETFAFGAVEIRGVLRTPSK